MKWAAKFTISALVTFVVLTAWGNYRWHAGFEDGADTVLCVMEHQIEGQTEAMKGRACRNIKGKKPPYFPGEPDD